MLDWFDYVFFTIIGLLVALLIWLGYVIATAPDTFTVTTPDGEVITCVTFQHQCDFNGGK